LLIRKFESSFYLKKSCIVKRTLPRILADSFYQQKRYDFSIKNILVKKDQSQKLNKFQDLVVPFSIYVAGYDWKNSFFKMNCKLTAFFGVDFIDLILLFIFFLDF
jgi:hypothetical protein